MRIDTQNLRENASRCTELFGVSVSETMAARGLVNGRVPVPKKMLWKVGVYSRLSECLIRDGRDSAARRVVSDTDTPKSSPYSGTTLNVARSVRLGWRS